MKRAAWWPACRRQLAAGWRLLNGDTAYARYLAHWQAHHAGHGRVPASRATFYREEIERRWNGVRRCC